MKTFIAEDSATLCPIYEEVILRVLKISSVSP